VTEFVTSGDGSRIAYDRVGEGPVIILVGGAMQFRAFDPTTAELARRLADSGFTVVNYDRRGRGESSDASAEYTPAAGVDHEVEDIAALIGAVGGSAGLYGSSSGGALCLWAAAAGIGVTRLALWEVPLGLEGGDDGSAHLAGLQERIAADDREATVAFFMRDMPPQWLEGARTSPAWPTMLSIAPTMAYDAAVLARSQAGTPWAQQWAAVTVPTLVIVGEETLPIFPPAADALVAALPRARQIRVPAANHSWELDAMATVLAEFFGAGAGEASSGDTNFSDMEIGGSSGDATT
jgi:pimeloyl-ACP methyl ester carboxylesterase